MHLSGIAVRTALSEFQPTVLPGPPRLDFSHGRPRLPIGISQNREPYLTSRLIPAQPKFVFGSWQSRRNNQDIPLVNNLARLPLSDRPATADAPVIILVHRVADTIDNMNKAIHIGRWSLETSPMEDQIETRRIFQQTLAQNAPEFNLVAKVDGTSFLDFRAGSHFGGRRRHVIDWPRRPLTRQSLEKLIHSPKKSFSFRHP